MKQPKHILPIIVTLGIVCFCSCAKNFENEPDLINIKITDSSCERLEYVTKIGNDYDTALDSLMQIYEPNLQALAIEGHYSGEGYYIDKEKINVDFDYDERDFILLTFKDKANINRLLFTNDVIDEKGNHYIHIACED